MSVITTGLLLALPDAKMGYLIFVTGVEFRTMYAKDVSTGDVVTIGRHL